LRRTILSLVTKLNDITAIPPAPFLGPVFQPGIEPVIATGFNYTPAEVAVHGVAEHGAIDLDVPRGTKILAPANGWYVCTYGEVLLSKDKSPRLLSMEQAQRGKAHNIDLRPPEPGNGPWPIYFGSFVIQGWHGRGRYTQYAHVDWVDERIPYHPPIEITDGQGRPAGNLQHAAILRAPVRQYREPGVAAFIRAGEVIGEVGMTGCGWGRRCYDSARFDENGRPDFRVVDYTYYTAPHLHFLVCGRRAPRTRQARRFDPFGIEGDIGAGYPANRKHWHERTPSAKYDPLWLPEE
jgi:hypothetical protein